MEKSQARFGALLLALSLSQALGAQPNVAIPPPVEATVVTDTDRAMRMTVPVTIGSSSGMSGPYQFVVDTGADRTVVSRELADRLALPNGETATLHTMSGVSSITTVIVPKLDLAGRTTANINAPALAQAHIGASGLIGIDSLKGRRIEMDFRRKTLKIAPPGEREKIEPDTIVVTAKSRYGQLVLVDASVDGIPIIVIIDTGAQNTVGNEALRRMLVKRKRKLEYFATNLIDVTGGSLPAQVASASRIRLGEVTMENLVIAFADAHPFKKFGIADRPAMLLGMDALRGFARVSVDFGARKVRFLLPGDA
jgi:predicted aspartyl protease